VAGFIFPSLDFSDGFYGSKSRAREPDFSEQSLYLLKTPRREGNPMKKLYVLCLVTLATVFIDILFFHSGAVSAQNTQQIRIQYVRPAVGNLDGAVLDVTGTVVGFACTSNSDGNGSCYVAVRR